jgi:hypothetical protein
MQIDEDDDQVATAARVVKHIAATDAASIAVGLPLTEFMGEHSCRVVGSLAASTNNHWMLLLPMVLSAVSASLTPMVGIRLGPKLPAYEVNGLLWGVVVAPSASGTTSACPWILLSARTASHPAPQSLQAKPLLCGASCTRLRWPSLSST